MRLAIWHWREKIFCEKITSKQFRCLKKRKPILLIWGKENYSERGRMIFSISKAVLMKGGKIGNRRISVLKKPPKATATPCKPSITTTSRLIKFYIRGWRRESWGRRQKD